MVQVSPIVIIQAMYQEWEPLPMRHTLAKKRLIKYDSQIAYPAAKWPGLAIDHSIQTSINSITIAPIGDEIQVADWVIVELRNKANFNTIVSRRCALLWADGRITESDSPYNPVTFQVSPDDYYVAIRHRNHLGIITPNALALSAVPVVHDFTTSYSQYMDNGTSDSAHEKNGVWMMHGGDFNKDGGVEGTGGNGEIDGILSQVLDGDITKELIDVYHDADLNCDGNVNHPAESNALQHFLGGNFGNTFYQPFNA